MSLTKRSCVILLVACIPALAPAQPLLTGEVYSLKAQDIIVPLTTNWKASISMMVEEGRQVQPGDVVVEFDGSKAALELEQQREAARAQDAITERDLAKLEKEFVQASYAVQLAEVELDLAEMRAGIPRDLIGALDTLENAIKKIDRKTRTRFKDTFESVNKGIQELFPILFGGGHAYLELTGDDLLTTGVSIMARPPGKRISSIHLMSGGEKALTAVAFVFAIFRLNPAPFCLLDEVDAPLDDANVARFTAMVKEMSETVQFVVVTHNKITMEMAHQLSGVTMREPGVSRLVQVDIDEAAKFAGD